MSKTMPSDVNARAAGAASRRVAERRGELRYPAANVDFRSRQIQASLIDLSRDGLSIESLEHPPIGTRLSFSLAHGRARAEAEGEVCWCNLKRTYRTVEGDVVPVYRAGIRLDDDRPRVLASISRAARLAWIAGSA